MSQRLKEMTRKDGKAKGLANRLNDGTRNHLTIADVFKSVIFNKPVKNKVYKSGKSKNKNKSSIT